MKTKAGTVRLNRLLCDISYLKRKFNYKVRHPISLKLINILKHSGSLTYYELHVIIDDISLYVKDQIGHKVVKL